MQHDNVSDIARKVDDLAYSLELQKSYGKQYREEIEKLTEYLTFTLSILNKQQKDDLGKRKNKLYWWAVENKIKIGDRNV